MPTLLETNGELAPRLVGRHVCTNERRFLYGQLYPCLLPVHNPKDTTIYPLTCYRFDLLSLACIQRFPNAREEQHSCSREFDCLPLFSPFLCDTEPPSLPACFPFASLPFDFERFTVPPCQLTFGIVLIFSPPTPYLLSICSGLAHLCQQRGSLPLVSVLVSSSPFLSLSWTSTRPISLACRLDSSSLQYIIHKRYIFLLLYILIRWLYKSLDEVCVPPTYHKLLWTIIVIDTIQI